MMSVALAMSEQFDTPVLLRTTTRIAHSHGPVELRERVRLAPAVDKYPRNFSKCAATPPRYRAAHRPPDRLRGDLPLQSGRDGRSSPGHHHFWRLISVRARGLSRSIYLTPGDDLSLASPVDLRHVDRLIVLEELDPFLEEEIALQGITCEGKSIFSIYGEFDPQSVREAAIAADLLPASERIAPVEVTKGELPPRPPVLCPGCPHRGVFVVMKKLKLPVQGDIGCYTLGGMPPLNCIDSCGCMGDVISPSLAIRPSSTRACRRSSTPSTTRANQSPSSWITVSRP